MIEIRKGSAPQFLLEKQQEAAGRCLNSKEAYGLLNGTERKALLAQMMREQGHLCAYCMRRIPDNRVPEAEQENIHTVTIEHWFPRSPKDGTEIGQGLDYQNLFAVCSGNKRQRPNSRRNGALTCDAKRKDSYDQLVLNPCNPETLESLYYQDDGSLKSDIPHIQDDIEVKLNLNCKADMVDLPECRRRVLDALQSEIPEDEEEALQYCMDALAEFEQESEEKTEYCGILIWWLKAYIESCTNGN